MKKLSFLYLLFAVVTMGLLSSCGNNDDEPKPAPTITFIPNKTSETVNAGETYALSVTYEAAQKLKAVNVYREQDGTGGTYKPAMTTGFNSDTKHIENYQLEAPSSGGPYVYRFEVEDRDGIKSTKSFTLNATQGSQETALSAPTAFEWKRVGAAAGTGLSTYGLAWTQNAGSGHAIIKKDADKLVVLTAADWTSITTKEALKAKVDGAADVADFRGVETGANKTYNHVIATKKGNDYFLINITNATVQTATAGTTITITGNSKK